MAQMQILRPAGKTNVISVTASSSTAITVNADLSNDQVNYATFLNTGTTTVALTLSPGTITAPASVLPVAGTPQNVIVLPPSMNFPVAYVVPACPFSVTAIGSGAGPALVYIQTVGDQS